MQEEEINSKKMNWNTYSNFTRDHCGQRIDSIVRNLELMLWYQYSRSVYDLFPASSRTFASSHSASNQLAQHESLGRKIDHVYRYITREEAYQTRSLFELCLLYYGQPEPSSSSSSSSAAAAAAARTLLGNGKERESRKMVMRDGERVETLLKLCCYERGIVLSQAMALFILSRPGLSETAAEYLMAIYFDGRNDRSRLESTVKEEANLVEEYALTIARKCNSDQLVRFYDNFRYLNIALNTSTLDVFLQASILSQNQELTRRVVNDMKRRGIESSKEGMVCRLLASWLYRDDKQMTRSQQQQQQQQDEEKVGERNEMKEILKEIEERMDDSWSTVLLHALFQVKDWNRPVANTTTILTFMEEHSIQLDFSSCCNLFDYYIQEGDFSNAVRLYNYMIKQHHKQHSGNELSGNGEMWKQMKAVVDQIHTSKRPLLLLGHKQEIALPRPNRKYEESMNTPELKRLFCVLMKDSPTVSIDTILRGMVSDFCKKSITGYGTWI